MITKKGWNDDLASLDTALHYSIKSFVKAAHQDELESKYSSSNYAEIVVGFTRIKFKLVYFLFRGKSSILHGRQVL